MKIRNISFFTFFSLLIFSLGYAKMDGHNGDHRFGNGENGDHGKYGINKDGGNGGRGGWGLRGSGKDGSPGRKT